LLARALDVMVPDFAIVDIPEHLEFELSPGLQAEAGASFGSKFEAGQLWGGKSSVPAVSNPEMFSRLVAFDTWLLNVDRYSVADGRIRENRQNLWLSFEGAPQGKFTLKAIDHGHCFRGTTWRARDVNTIAWVKDENIYGYFPEFHGHLLRSEVETTLQKASALGQAELRDIVDHVPREWDLSADSGALVGFLMDRAKFLNTELSNKLWPQGKLDLKLEQME
jgi:hypothetical protein